MQVMAFSRYNYPVGGRVSRVSLIVSLGAQLARHLPSYISVVDWFFAYAIRRVRLILLAC